MPWTYENPPDVAQNWTQAEIEACVDAANAVLAEGGSDEEAIYACVSAAGKRRAAGASQEVRAMSKKTKTFRAPIQLKEDGEAGTFRSVFAQFNVIDHDGDVTRPGAFQDGQEVVIEGWNHDYGLPPGKGVIHTSEREAWVEGQFFLDTTSGKDHYRTLKNLDGLEEWSYTFEVEQGQRGEFNGEDVYYLEKMDVWGVAPVTRGAGIGTRTVALKDAGRMPAVQSDQFTEAEIAQLKAMIRGDDVDDSGNGEGEVPGNVSGDKPSGVSPSVVLAEVEIETLDLEE